jgi:formyl-CoA transferase/CoA:oxalate CoA-transferase
MAILASLRARDANGEGARLEASLMDTALGWVSYHVTGYLATGVVPGPMGSRLGSIAPYEAFPTADGHVMIAAGNDALFARLCTALGLEELVEDPRFVTNPQRVAHRDALTAILTERTVLRSTEEMVERTRAHDVPCSAIHDIAQVVDDPQVAAAEMLTPAPHPTLPDYRDVALPFRIDGARPRGAQPPPAAGEHTAEVLAELGYSPEEIASLLDSGAVGQARPAV